MGTILFLALPLGSFGLPGLRFLRLEVPLAGLAAQESGISLAIILYNTEITGSYRRRLVRSHVGGRAGD